MTDDVTLDDLLDAVEREGLLVNNDVRLPSVVSMIAGAPIRGSWWGHPRGREIYAKLSKLGEHPDVLPTKLVSGKVTFIDRRLWPELYAVGRERGTWQTDRLDRNARRLLEKVDTEKTVLSSGPPAALLEHLILVHGVQIVGDDGIQRIRLQTWETWREETDVELEEIDPEAARKRFDSIVDTLNQEFGGRAKLPWR